MQKRILWADAVRNLEAFRSHFLVVRCEALRTVILRPHLNSDQ